VRFALGQLLRPINLEFDRDVGALTFSLWIGG